MATYSYIAIDKAGKQIKASIDADTIEKATQQIKTNGLVPMSVEEQSVMNKEIELGGLFVKKATTRDLSLFCRQFVSMHRAGVTILDTLRMLSEQTENPSLKAAAQETYLGVQKGDSLAVSMSRSPKVFSGLLIHMVTAGESSGSLDIAFERMAEQFEKSAKIQGLVKKAMVYPIAVAIVAVVVVIVMLTFIVPNFMEMFADMDIEMPAITLAVVAASEFMQTYWYIVVAAIGAIVGFIIWFKKQPMGETLFAKAAMKIPMISELTIKSSSAKLARTLSTMLAAGIPMPEAVEITAGTLGNLYYREALMNARNDVMQGVPLSQPLERCGLFPPMVYHMTRIGEETGNVEDMLNTLADYYEEEVEVATQSLMAALEPLMIVIMAGVCMVIIGAVMAPMASMYGGLDAL